MSKKISVIVPVYKVENYLNECIKSIVNQTYTNLEVILVDDGSPDNCPQICDAWALKDDRIKVLHKSNGGLSDARNAGMRIASGDYFAFLDSDDWIDNKFYEILMDEANKSGSDIVSGGYTVISTRNADNISLGVTKHIIMNNVEAMSALIDDNEIKQVVWNKIYRRQVVEGLFFEVGKYHEDEFWSYKAIGNSKKMSYIDYNGYFYYQRPDSIMGIGFSEKRLDALEARAKRQEYLKDRFPELVNSGAASLWELCIFFGQKAIKNKQIDIN